MTDKSFNVRIPIAGWVEFNSITANSENEAINKAWEIINNNTIDWTVDGDNYELTWDYYEKLHEGGGVSLVELNKEGATENDD